ncbi:MAG: sugar phosphate isomerase/epimerase family protein, partial [Planctomycetota bacterium]
MESIKRRTFLSSSIAAAGALALAGDSAKAVKPAATSRRPNPIAVSTYSFWRFKKGMKMPIEKCIDEAARMGFDGVDLLLYQMESEENSYLQKIKRHALINGLDLCCMSTHQGFVYPDKEKRQQNIDLTLRQIETAYRLGVPIVRLNTGRWRTTRSFD